MTTSEMAAVIINKYGTTIRGKEVADMSDHQIYAIYTSIRKRESKEGIESQLVRTSAARCGSCGWFAEGKCGKYGFKTNATTLACTKSYSDIQKNGHQISMFESDH